MNLIFDPDVAWCLLAVQRCSDGRLGWSVAAALPGDETYVDKRYIGPAQPADVVASWTDSFHSESKTWRALIECVLSDWATTQAPLF